VPMGARAYTLSIASLYKAEVIALQGTSDLLVIFKVWICSLHFTDDSFMNKNQYDAGFVGRLKLKVEAVPTLKKHKSEPHVLSETVPNVCVELALDV